MPRTRKNQLSCFWVWTQIVILLLETHLWCYGELANYMCNKFSIYIRLPSYLYERIITDWKIHLSDRSSKYMSTLLWSCSFLLKSDFFGFFFQSEQYFSLTTYQPEQCFCFFFQRNEHGIYLLNSTSLLPSTSLYGIYRCWSSRWSYDNSVVRFFDGSFVETFVSLWKKKLALN